VNILQVTIRADYGGGPEHIYLLEKYINKKLFNVYTACPFQRPYYPKFEELSLACFELPFRKFDINALINLAKFTQQKKIDVIHCHGKGAGIYGRLLAILLKIPVVYTLHGISYGEYSFLKKIIYFQIEKILNFFTNKIINVSHEERQLGIDLKLYSKSKSIVISNGIDVDKYEKAVPIQRKDIGLESSDFVIGNISRFSYQKGLEYLILAFNNLDIANKKLVIVGDGQLRNKLTSLVEDLNIKDKVIMLGFRDDIPQLLKAFDMYVTTALWEGLPISLLEAMAAGLPIVATDVVGNNELIQHNYNGLLCKSKDISDITKKMHLMYEADEKFKYINNSSNMVREKYSATYMVKQIEELYRSVYENNIK
jgi:glycosyltransferase involved in cell wall biosynthesis